jgi:hypothetical protein
MIIAHLVPGSSSIYHRYAGDAPATSQIKGKVEQRLAGSAHPKNRNFHS